jgi:hypothetical protein
MSTAPQITVVFDTSVLLAYARAEPEAMHVGELLQMIEEDDGASLVGVPAACYLAAFRQLTDMDQQARLTTMMLRIENAAVLLPLMGIDTMQVALADAQLGNVDIAHAITETERTTDAVLATFLAKVALQRLGESRVLDLNTAWHDEP